MCTCFNKEENFLMYSNIVRKGYYIHSKSQRVYEVIGTARSVEAPAIRLVVYKQLEESVLKHTNIVLPAGSLWTRDIDEFNAVIDTKGTRRFEECSILYKE